MKRMTSLRQSVAVSAVLMAILFVLPLAVIVPFRSELFSSEERGCAVAEGPVCSGGAGRRNGAEGSGRRRSAGDDGGRIPGGRGAGGNAGLL